MAHDYENVVREWYNRLRPQFLNKLTSRYSGMTLGDAENIYQDAFLAVYDNIRQNKVKEQTAWSSYIFKIGMNLASKQWRTVEKTQSYDYDDSEEVFDSSVRTARQVEEKFKEIQEDDNDMALYSMPEAQSLLGEELAHISEPCRSILIYFYYEKMKMDEIAGELGYKNSTTAKSKKSQCMKDLIARVKASFLRAGFVD